MTCIPNASAAVGATWTKSSYSGGNSDCVEVAHGVTKAMWSKSSYSGATNDCLEVAHGVTNVMPVRDSKRPTGPAIVFPAGAWTAFVADLKADA